MEIRKLHPSDLDAAYRLSTQANWNQLPADWQRLIDLWPDHCFAGLDGSRLVATGTLATYRKALAWVGMILVDRDYRHRGLGTQMFAAIIDHAERIGIELLALDATHLGHPLYLKFGFVDRKLIRRWIYRDRTSVPNGPTKYHSRVVLHQPLAGADDTGETPVPQVATGIDSTPKPTTRPIYPEDWPAISTFDQQAVHVDRFMLLRHLAVELGAQARILNRSGRIEGFGFYRRGRYASMIAPLLAQSPDQAALLLDDLLVDHQKNTANTPLLIDVPNNEPFHAMLESRGFTIERELVRMVRPATNHPALDTLQVFAGSGFELG